MRELVIRPQANNKKIHSKNEFELCYLRHQYLRKVDYNPTATEMEPYFKIVNYMSRRTFYSEFHLFTMIGFQREDIVNIGRVYLVEFLGLFALDSEKNADKLDTFVVAHQGLNGGDSPTDEDVLSKNKAHFTLFMKQRMEDLVRISKQKAKNIKGLQVDEYIPFCGDQEPPTDLFKLLEDNQAYGFKKCDKVQFKAIRKRAKANLGEAFRFAGNWYIAVPLAHRSLTILDFAGAGLDPHESLHNQNPEQLMLRRQNDISFDKKKKKFKAQSKEERARQIKLFVDKNKNNPLFQGEIFTAKRMLRNLGVEYGE